MDEITFHRAFIVRSTLWTEYFATYCRLCNILDEICLSIRDISFNDLDKSRLFGQFERHRVFGYRY